MSLKNIMKKRDKDRLYIALHERTETVYPKMAHFEDMYHWSFIIGPGPKKENNSSMGKRLHIKQEIDVHNTSSRARYHWVYEEKETTVLPEDMLLVRLVVAKIQDTEKLKCIIRTTPLHPEEKTFNAVEWIRDAYFSAKEDNEALGASMTSWEEIRDMAMAFANQKKMEHRFSGQGWAERRPPTWDLLQHKETIV